MSYFETDKITYHEYFQAYVQLAGEIGPDADILELGVQNGESLRMWQSLFPLGRVAGVDISRSARWPDGTYGLICAQDDPGLPAMLEDLHQMTRFGLIVDDASHNGIASRKSFELLWPLVRPGGYYVIEDWTVALRDDPHWGPQANWGESMLRTAEGLLRLLSRKNGECDFITYRYGMIIIHKNRSGG